MKIPESLSVKNLAGKATAQRLRATAGIPIGSPIHEGEGIQERGGYAMAADLIFDCLFDLEPIPGRRGRKQTRRAIVHILRYFTTEKPVAERGKI